MPESSSLSLPEPAGRAGPDPDRDPDRKVNLHSSRLLCIIAFSNMLQSASAGQTLPGCGIYGQLKPYINVNSMK